MAKVWKFQKERRKRRFKLAFGLLAMILIIGSALFLFNERPVQEFLINDDISTPKSHQSQIIAPDYLNKEDQFFTFISDLSGAYDIFDFLYTDVVTSKGIYYYPGEGYSMLAGLECPEQELIRFSYCDNMFDKNSCNKDIFLNMWLVNNPTDYPNFKNYYTGNSDGFYFTYSCYYSEKYSAITVVDNIENRYLYGTRCINSNDPNWKYATDYGFEKACLDALQEKLNQPTTSTCSPQTYDEFVCKESSRLYQKERLSDCSIGYTEFVRTCEWGCDNGACLPVPTSTCEYKEFDDTQCIDGALFQKARKENCQISYDIFLGECDVQTSGTTDTTDPLYADIDQCYICTSSGKSYIDVVSVPYGKDCNDVALDLDLDEDTYTNTEQECRILKPELFESQSDGAPITLNCRAYQSIEDSKCSFNIVNSVSSQGFSDLYEDYQSYIIGIGVFIVVLLGIVVVFGGKKNGKKK